MSMAVIGAVGIGTGLVGSIGGSLIQGSSQRDAQSLADATNRYIADENRRQNQEQFDRVNRNDFLLQDQLLPYFQQYTQGFLNDGGSFQQQIAERQALIDQFAPTLQRSRDFLGDVYNGSNLNTRLNAAGVTGDARIESAVQQQAAIDQALREVQSQLAAENARKGFVGGGSFANNRLLASTVGARQDASNLMGVAELANAADKQRLIEADLAEQGAYAGAIPGIVAGQMGLQDMPAQSVYNKLGQVVQPLSYFKGNPMFSQGAGPMVSPNPSAGIEGRVLADAGSALMDYGFQSSLARQQGRSNLTNWNVPAVPKNRTGTVFDFSKNLSDYSPSGGYVPKSQFDFSSTFADYKGG
jgi:hypothetical protein